MLRQRRQLIRGRRLKCPFCQSDKLPSYKEADSLRHYLTDRGRIIAGGRTGVCAKHQRVLTRQIKRARHLALLPFVTKV